MSVNTHLSNLASELVLSQSERTSISTSISTLSSRADSYFSGVIEKFQFGSSVRDTILPRKADGLSDIDYLIVFDTKKEVLKPQAYLDRIRKFVSEKYQSSEISQNHPTIVLSLNHIRFELVPGINNYGLQIPSPAKSWGDWMYTDPAAANKALLDKNKAENFQIKPLVRLIKYWNVRQGRPFDSFAVESHIVGRYFYSCSTLRDYFFGFWEGFSCSPDSSQSVKDKVASAKNHAAKAKQYEKDDMPVNAELEIKKIVPSL